MKIFEDEWKTREKRLAEWRNDPALNGLSGTSKCVLTRIIGEFFFQSGRFDKVAALVFFQKPVLDLMKYRGLGKKTLIEISIWLGLPEPDFKGGYQHWMNGLSVRLKNCLCNAGLDSEIAAKNALENGSLRKFRNVGKLGVVELQNHFSLRGCKCPKCGHEFHTK